MKALRKTKLVSLLAVFFSVLFLTSTTVEAASTRTYYTYGSTYSAKTFTVTTDKATTIKFTQKKGTLSYLDLVGRQKTMNAYGLFTVEYRASGGSWQSVSFTGASTSIKLKANTTYTIRIKTKSSTEYQRHYGLLILRVIRGWKKDAEWTLTAPNIKSLKV